MEAVTVQGAHGEKGWMIMKARLLSLLCAVVGLLSLAASDSVAGNVSWSVSVFSGPLGECGHWVERPGYGRCWYPSYVSSDWRPYCEGYWMWTDNGWYWVSDEPWAWATYHYGRWVYDPYYGWVWVPDTEWGPSWVCWREGGEYVGWAPLPPRAVFGSEGYIVVRDRPVQDRFFVFVGIGHFAEPVHRHTVIVNKTTVINQTVNITNITRVNNVVVNRGPKFERIQRVSTRKLTEPPPHMTVDRAGATRHKEAAREIPQTTSGEQPRPSRSQEKAKKREPEIIHGSPSAAPPSTGVTSEPDKRRPEKRRVEPQLTESQPPPSEGMKHYRKVETGSSDRQQSNQNFGAKPAKPNAPAEPDSVPSKHHATHEQPSKGQSQREERTVEKHGQSHQDAGREEKPKKGEQGGD